MNKIHLKGGWVIKAAMKDIYKIMTDFDRIPEYFWPLAKSMYIFLKTIDKE